MRALSASSGRTSSLYSWVIGVLNGALVEFDLDAQRAKGIEAVSREWKP
jgi:hypothetical protein